MDTKYCGFRRFLRQLRAAVRWESILQVREDCRGISEVSVAKHTPAMSPPLPLLSLFHCLLAGGNVWAPSLILALTSLPFSPSLLVFLFLRGLAVISTGETGPMESQPHHTGLQLKKQALRERGIKDETLLKSSVCA